MSELTERVQAAIEPLAALVAELDSEISTGELRIRELREQRRGLKAALAALQPKPKPQPKPKKPRPRSPELDQKKARVRSHLLGKGVHEDITAMGLKDNGLGDPPISVGMLYGILRELHEDDFLRLDRIGKGGQEIYRKAIP